MINITNHKNGLKMEKFLSINVKLCDFCNEMSTNKALICSQCYAKYMINRYKRLKVSMENNFNELSTKILTNEEIDQTVKKINGKKNIAGLRFDSIGELINDKHVINLQNIALKVKANIPITLWTKRPAMLFKVLSKPAFRVIYSNPIINSYIDPKQKDARISHTFNVYDNPQKMADDITDAHSKGINAVECHGKCNICMYCYNFDDDHKAIFELTKRAQNKLSKV